jgi:hypothetical protein
MTMLLNYLENLSLNFKVFLLQQSLFESTLFNLQLRSLYGFQLNPRHHLVQQLFWLVNYLPRILHSFTNYEQYIGCRLLPFSRTRQLAAP